MRTEFTKNLPENPLFSLKYTVLLDKSLAFPKKRCYTLVDNIVTDGREWTKVHSFSLCMDNLADTHGRVVNIVNER